MYVNLQERCEIEFERYVTDVLAIKPDYMGMVTANTPWGFETIFKAGVPCLISRIHASLAAKVWFAETELEWGPLPMGAEACALISKARGAPYLLGAYSFSLQVNDFNYSEHPQIYDFCCGATACSGAPEHVKEDLELGFEFPARELPGLSSRMVWFEPRAAAPAA